MKINYDSRSHLRHCIIPDKKWNGDTGIAKLIKQYREENPELYYSEVRIRAARHQRQLKKINNAII